MSIPIAVADDSLLLPEQVRALLTDQPDRVVAALAADRDNSLFATLGLVEDGECHRCVWAVRLHLADQDV